jgi:uncharacterized protein with PQ loop repeat
MVPDSVIITANLCQIATTFISLSAYLPQWIKLIRTRSSGDISIRSWLLWFLSAFFALFYAAVQLLINGRGWPLIITTLVSLGSTLLTISLILKFRPRKA